MKQVDVAIIGSGPAGLSAAISSASEGYSTLVIDAAEKWGGQAAASTRIENVFGYPLGIPGSTLTDMAVKQAQRLGVEFLRGKATTLTPNFDAKLAEIVLDRPDGRFEVIAAKATVLAMGVKYRKLDIGDSRKLEGKTVFYATTASSDEVCRIRPCVVVGGGNSAGQAAIHLSRYAPKVYLVIRGNSLEAGMSDYLSSRIKHTPNIEVRLNTQVDDVMEDGPDTVVWLADPLSSQPITASALFVMIGAEPNTKWTGVKLDEKGYIYAPDYVAHHPEPHRLGWLVPHDNILAVGDVRAGSVKRVASGIGEGATIMRHINRIVNT